MEREASPAADGRPVKLQKIEEAAAAAAASEAEPAAAAAGDSPGRGSSSSDAPAAAAAAAAAGETDCSSPRSPRKDASPRRSSSSSNGSSSSSSKEVEAAWAETEYKNWKVNAQVLYDVLLCVPLEWPALTVQWLPGLTPCSSSSVVKQRLLTATHTNGAEDDALLVLQVELPVGPFDDTQTNEYKERGDYEGFHYGLSSYKTKVVKRLPHPQESNCARYMPQQPSIVASCAVDGRVLLYDLEAPGICEGPEASLIGNKGEA
ncbi:WD domain, G-beta repeat domain containing protein, putative, partial [Eimeria tenella]